MSLASTDSERAPGLSLHLAEHIARCAPDALPERTLRAAKRAILDGIGVMLAASGASEDVRPFIELVRAAGTRAEATVLGCDLRVSAGDAALANGAMAHALDFEDAFDPAPVHPDASLLPVALALAESHAPCSGREFLSAVALGCDLVCRMSLSLRRPLEEGGWYPPPILGAWGATAAAARLLRLTPTQMCDAWSLLLCQNSCAGEIKYSAETTLRAVREAFPAQAALQSALLAAHGVRGFAAPLEGRSAFYRLFAGGEFDPRDLTEDLGSRFWIEALSFKKWPSCRGTHAYIEAVQQLKQAHRFTLEDIAAISLAGGEVQRMLVEPLAQKRAPRTLIDAKFSLPFTVALAAPEVTLDGFTPQALHDRELLALAARTEFIVRPDWGRSRAAAGELTLRLRDGRVLSMQIEQALGEPARPLADQELRDKFIDCAARAAVPVPAGNARQYVDRVFALEREGDAAAALLSFA